MPSYIADDYQNNGTTIDFDSQFRLSMPGAKLDLSPRHLPDKSSHVHIRSFDESSANSTNTSDLSDTRSQPNGDTTRPTSMSSLSNGNPQRDACSPSPDEFDNGTNHSSFEVQHPAPAAPSRPPPSAPSRHPPRTPPQAQEFTPTLNGNRNADTSAAANVLNAANGSPAPLETILSSETLSVHGTPSPALFPAALASSVDNDRSRSISSPHRYSSPAVYQQPNGTAVVSASAIHPPPHSGLKHRHTLEVPKTTSGRASRDGQDAYASGRFSPTVTTGRRGSLSLGRRNTRSLHSEVPRDEIVPDEDAIRWAEAYRQKRASKKKKREEEDDDRVIVGTKVDENHVNWVTAYNMLTGIRVSVSRTNAKIDRPLTDADFEAKQKSTFDIAGNELVPSAKYDFKFKDYAPWVFRSLRNKFGLDPADYLVSLTGKYILSELGSPGKSGSFFYYSRDYKYIIKTIHHAEHKFLRKILKEYYHHVTENPNTLLSQFYGLHRVKLPFGKKIHFVVMNNLFPPHKDIHMTFDLKGSTIGRDYREEDLEKNPRATLKDLNWMRRKKTLELGIQKKRLFLEQLQRDVRLLQRLEIMDYSLLIGIHDLQRGNQEKLRDQTLKVFNPGGSDEQDPISDPTNVLMRTPSKLENARKARELRQMIQSEKPVPVDRMPDTLDEAQNRSVFYSDDGGFGATHENNAPANEVYYLGVIDCLTHYGIIKKIEHFWKGLSSDRTQISALPPQQYGERFFQFIEGVTMSQEEAARKRLEEEEAEAIAAAEGQRERISSWSSSGRRRLSATAPPVPTYNPPPPPSNLPTTKAESEAGKMPEGKVSNRVLTTHHEPPAQGQTILPVVEEAAESSASGRSRTDSSRSQSPLKDMPGRAPPTPPKPGHLVVDLKNGDSGYMSSAKPRLSSSSLEKDLPPLPQVDI